MMNRLQQKNLSLPLSQHFQSHHRKVLHIYEIRESGTDKHFLLCRLHEIKTYFYETMENERDGGD